MKPARFFQTSCDACGGRIQYPANQVGTTTQCPHCGETTELALEIQQEEPTLPRRMIVWVVIAGLILVGGLAASMVALKRAQRMAERSQNRTAGAPAQTTALTAVTEAPAGIDGTWAVSGLQLRRDSAGRELLIRGAITNLLARPRAGVVSQIELLDATGKRVALAQQENPFLQPNQVWSFEFAQPASTASSARVISVTEK